MNVAQDFSDADFRGMVLRSLRLIGVLTAIATPLVWWKLGWQSSALLWVGAAISAVGVWKWLRLMTAIMVRMDAGGEARPMGGVLVAFFAQMAGALGVLYVSLKFLDGSVYALIAGLSLSVVALSIEGLRAMKAWTM